LKEDTHPSSYFLALQLLPPTANKRSGKKRMRMTKKDGLSGNQISLPCPSFPLLNPQETLLHLFTFPLVTLYWILSCESPVVMYA
jgi:hypothetical protein